MASRLVAYAFIAIMTLFSVLPTVYMIDLSLRNPIQSFQPSLITEDPTADNYRTAFSAGGIAQYFINSVIVAVCSVAVTLIVVVLSSFALSRLRMRGRNIVFYTLIAGLMVPLASLIVPLTVELKHMSLLNNYFGLIGPYVAIGIPFGLLVLKGVMDSFPRELEEAAVLDGASPLRTLVTIVIPIVRPSLLVIAVWQFLYSWNEFFLALVVMTTTSHMTVPLLPLQFEGPFQTNPGALFAMLTVISAIPIVFYVVAQRWFVGGLLSGGVKG